MEVCDIWEPREESLLERRLISWYQMSLIQKEKGRDLTDRVRNMDSTRVPDRTVV